MFAFLIERTGWSLEYLASLSLPQINSIIDGISDNNSKINRKNVKNSEEKDYIVDNKKKKDEKTKEDEKESIDILAAFSGKSGVKMTDKATKKLVEALNKQKVKK